MLRNKLHQAVGGNVLPIDPSKDGHTVKNDPKDKAKKAKSGKVKAPDHKAAIDPQNAEEFLAALLCPIFEDIKQPGGLQHYHLPWPGYTGLDQPRKILAMFEKHLGADLKWEYFNGSDASAAQMSQACDPVKAACENGTNMFDACIMAAAQKDGALETTADGKVTVKAKMASTLSSPMAACEHYFNISRDDFCDPTKIGDLGEFAKGHCVVRVFGGYPGNGNAPCVIDFVDAGCGVAPTNAAWEGTLLSLNRGFKKLLHIAIGKWGWGAAGCYQNGDLSLLVSSLPGTNEVMFTVVEKAFMEDEDRVPTFRYLTIKGSIPKVKLPKWWNDVMMPGEGRRPSTVIRHFGYQAPLSRGSGEKSIGGVLDRLLPNPILPVWTEYVHMVKGYSKKEKELTSYPGHSRTGRVVRGTRNRLFDYWMRQKKGTPVTFGGTPAATIRHYTKFDIQLNNFDFTGRTGVCPAGFVNVEVFVIQPRDGQTEVDALRNYIDPDRCVLFHLDGQTHHEEFSSVVRAPTRGADLAHLGRRCVVAIDCSTLTRESKFALFGSSREQMKGTELHKLLKERLIKRLGGDQKLRQIDGEIATERRKNMKMPDQDEFADALSKYLDKTSLDFPKFQREAKRRVRVLEDQVQKGGKKEPPKPIKEELPPRLLQWAIKTKVIKMYPGQSYSWVLETSAPSSWWAPSDLMNSHIKVMANGVSFTGSDSFQAGRIRCHFECPKTAKPGDTAFIQAQMDYAPDFDLASLTAPLKIEVVQKGKDRPGGPPTGPGTGPSTGGKGKKIIKVEVWRDQMTKVEVDFLPPVPIKFSEDSTMWLHLGWDRDASKPAFTVLVESGEATIYYNAENKDFIDARDATIKKHPGTEDKFLKEYEMKLALEGIFMLNENTSQDSGTPGDVVQRIDRMNRATARNLSMDVARELDLEAKLEAERASTP